MIGCLARLALRHMLGHRHSCIFLLNRFGTLLRSCLHAVGAVQSVTVGSSLFWTLGLHIGVQPTIAARISCCPFVLCTSVLALNVMWLGIIILKLKPREIT